MMALAIALLSVVACVLVEWRFENVKFPKLPFWPLKGIAASVLFMALAIAIPAAIATALPPLHLADLSRLPGLAQIGLGTLAVQAGVYAWHRSVHRVRWFFRWSHRVHHTPPRVDTWGAFYFHPADMVTAILIQGAIPVFVVRLDPQAMAVVGAISIFLSVFQHTNVRTPRWIGYIVTRPESHCIHHEPGAGGFNYGDLAIFDIMFGTFRNPRTWNGKAGL